MSKKLPYLVETILGLFLTLSMVYAYAKRAPLVEIVSLKTYDSLSRLSPPAKNTNTIQIVEIDDQAVTSLGRWPWPRSLVAQLVDEIVTGGAKVIGLNIFYTEPETNQGYEEVNQLREKFAGILKRQKSVAQKKKISLKEFEQFLDGDLIETSKALDGDSILSESIQQATNVVLPMYFQPGDTLGNNLELLPAFFNKEKLTLTSQSTPAVPPGKAAILPLVRFGQIALAIGHSNLNPDVDGSLRRIAPVMRYGTNFYPSFAIETIREFLNLQLNALNWNSAEGFSLMKAKIPIDDEGTTYIKYAGPSGTFQRTSAVDVLAGGVPENLFNNKVVLVGVTAAGLAPAFIGPGGLSYTGLEIWANHMENILSQEFIRRPPWAEKAEWGMIGLAAMIVILILPFLRARFSIPLAVLALCGLLGTSWFFFTKQGIWVTPAYGSLLLLSGFALIVGRRLIFTEKRKEMVEAEGVETNKMLGLSFQGQGMLDLAFEKFRRCPLDDAMKELLYNLGLDMERKRQFSKAAAVYEHIASVDRGYKDIKDKIDLLKKAGEGAVFGALGKKGNDATVVVQGLGQHTTLGRYEVMKELGRGAMGIVYLGKDPKINRQVAIKTLRFEEQMDEEQTKSVKERFFREAESAGNLTHPNIIRIFDAGEDQDVAYIAMELLEGQDLKSYSEKDHLLPTRRVVELVAQVAEGLDYAHRQGVVHRDIKPGNVMLLKDGTLRITDFGIARIQATSKTATGAVLGTPAYMSPEQVNGKKADGRADIFSLGVMFFEFLTGQKPFYADSIAALLYRIANVQHPDPREFNKKLPAVLIPIIDKALAKEAAERYQAAGEMALQLRQLLSRWDENAPEPSQGNSPSNVGAAVGSSVGVTLPSVPPETITPVSPISEPIPPSDSQLPFGQLSEEPNSNDVPIQHEPLIPPMTSEEANSAIEPPALPDVATLTSETAKPDFMSELEKAFSEMGKSNENDPSIETLANNTVAQEDTIIMEPKDDTSNGSESGQ